MTNILRYVIFFKVILLKFKFSFNDNMKKIFAVILGVILITMASAAYSRQITAGTLETKGTSRALTLPVAADHSPVIHLGQAVDPQSGNLVEGYAIIHYAKSGQAAAKPARNQCYGFLASGAKWKTMEPWFVNPINASGMDNTFIFDNLAADISKWEDATDGIAGNNAGMNVLGGGNITYDALMADSVSPDGLNEVYFGSITNPGAIAVTTVWGIFSGPPSQRKLVEWDMIFDEVDYGWSAAGESGKMDFENIATHELGHSVGMADLYTSECATETMYGYAGYGEINKRDLNAGDIAGMNQLY